MISNNKEIINKNKEIIVFTDFDGTITYKDIGDELFIAHGDFEPYHTQLIKKEIKPELYWRTLLNSLRGSDKKKIIQQFVLECETDAYFPAFANFCTDHVIKLYIISDGFDAYINPVIERMGLNKINIFCNKIIFNKDNSIEAEFPYADESCECLVASCKRNKILSIIPEDVILVYIGDGYSDFCAASHCDVIFAKDKLAAYCSREKLPHYPFSTFFDVKRIFEKLILNKKLKRRKQAELLRKKAYEIE